MTAAAFTALAVQIRDLEQLDLNGLREAWGPLYGPPPKLRSVELLRLALAWRLQAAVHGGLDAAARRRLRAGVGLGQRDHVEAGIRISKEWRGVTYHVDRIEAGYLWRDRTYASLSAVAFVITGVKHNGPRFFGLRAEAAS